MQSTSVQPSTSHQDTLAIPIFSNQVANINKYASSANLLISAMQGINRIINIKGLPKLPSVIKKKEKNYSYKSVLFQCGIMNSAHKKRIDDSYERYINHLRVHHEKLAKQERENQVDNENMNTNIENQKFLMNAFEDRIIVKIENEIARHEAKKN